MMVRAHVFYSGTVQGVGFRYTTEHLAHELPLTGWVRNLSDGQVELMVEGRREDVERLLTNINHRFKEMISHQQVEWLSAWSQFTDFKVSY